MSFVSFLAMRSALILFITYISSYAVDSSGDGSNADTYTRDYCYCPHPQSDMPNGPSYQTDSELRSLILKKQIEYWTKFLREEASAIYRFPGINYPSHFSCYITSRL